MEQLWIRNKKFIRKEVKRMKRICVLTIATAVFFLLVGASAFALDPATIKPSETIKIDTVYSVNQYGVITGGQTTTTITGIDEDGRNFSTTQISYSSWKGGGLVVTSVDSTTRTYSSDGYDVTRKSYTTYTYDANGILTGGTGTSSVTGGKLENNQGTFDSSTTNTYMVKDGQLLVTASDTSQTIKVGTQASQYISSKVTYTYALMGGQWVITSAKNEQNVSQPNGDYTKTVTTTTYTRNTANGIITAMSQVRTGERQETDATTGQKTKSTLKNYVCVYKQAVDGRWYIQQEKYDWVPVATP